MIALAIERITPRGATANLRSRLEKYKHRALIEEAADGGPDAVWPTSARGDPPRIQRSYPKGKLVLAGKFGRRGDDSPRPLFAWSRFSPRTDSFCRRGWNNTAGKLAGFDVFGANDEYQSRIGRPFGARLLRNPAVFVVARSGSFWPAAT